MEWAQRSDEGVRRDSGVSRAAESRYRRYRRYRKVFILTESFTFFFVNINGNFVKINWKCVTETENWKPLIKRVNSALFPKVMHVSIPKRTIGTLWFHFLLEVFALFYRKFCKILRNFTESFKFLNCGTGKVLLFCNSVPKYWYLQMITLLRYISVVADNHTFIPKVYSCRLSLLLIFFSCSSIGLCTTYDPGPPKL